MLSRKPGSLESGFFIVFFPESSLMNEAMIFYNKIPVIDEPLKGSWWIRIEKRLIKSPIGEYPLTEREGRLLFDFLNQDDFFLHNREICERLSITDEKSLVSRLRTKLRGVRDPISGSTLYIHCIKGQGYYLG